MCFGRVQSYTLTKPIGMRVIAHVCLAWTGVAGAPPVIQLYVTLLRYMHASTMCPVRYLWATFGTAEILQQVEGVDDAIRPKIYNVGFWTR